MSQINMSSVGGRVKKFAESPKGKKRIREVIEQYRRDGVSKTGVGDMIVTKQVMIDVTAKLMAHIRFHARQCDLPASVLAQVDQIWATDPIELPDGNWSVELYFEGDLHRDSLYSKKYDGVSNIIALFNNGFLASDTVYGVWSGHNNPKHKRGYVASKIGRPALQFLQAAVEDFNRTLGGANGAVASLAPIYTEVPTVVSTGN